MPLLVMLVIPLVADLDVKDVGVAVVDRDHSSCHAPGGGHGRLGIPHRDGSLRHLREALRHIERGDADVVLTIPSGYFRDLSGASRPTST